MFINKYEILKPISEGAYSKVYKVSYNNINYAMKIFDISDKYAAKIELNIYKKIKLLDQSHFLQLIDHFEGLSHYYLIFQYIDAIDIKSLTIYQKCQIIKQLFECINLLHLNGIIHGDIKPENILVDSNMNLFLIDLGSSSADGLCHEIVGTLDYNAPEIIFKKKYSFKSDIFSSSLTSIFILTGFSIFDTEKFLCYDESIMDTNKFCLPVEHRKYEFEQKYKYLYLLESLIDIPSIEDKQSMNSYYVNGSLKFHRNVKKVKLYKYLYYNSDTSKKHCKIICKYAKKGLHINPRKRYGAIKMINIIDILCEELK